MRRKRYLECFPSPLVPGLTWSRHFDLIMPKEVCLEMADTPGSPLAASLVKSEDRAMLFKALVAGTFLLLCEGWAS